jgi:hypothetical protein
MSKKQKQWKQTKSSLQKLADKNNGKTVGQSKTKEVLEIVKLILSLVTELIKLLAALAIIWKTLIAVFIATVWQLC